MLSRRRCNGVCGSVQERGGTSERGGVAGHGAQPVDGVDDEVLLQGEVGQPHALGTVDDEHDVQGPAVLLTVWGGTRPSGRGARWTLTSTDL